MSTSAKRAATVSGQILRLVMLVTVLSLAPSILVMVTSFTRIVIVLSFLRTAIGLQQTPPNSVLVGLALFLTLFVMSPTLEAVYRDGLEPLLAEEIDESEALTRAAVPVRTFMLRQVRPPDVALFAEIARLEPVPPVAETPFRVLLPAFMISELRRAFEIGFLIFLPFLIIDMVVASILMSMGMMMLPPVMISLPFKLIFFVLVDGWALVVGSLVQSFGPRLSFTGGSAHAVEQRPELAHPSLDDAGTLADVGGWPPGRPQSRIGQDGRDQRRLAPGQIAGRLAEIAARSGLGAVHAGSGLRDVEIDFHDPPLAPDQLQLRRERHLEQLAQGIAPGPEQHVLRDLHADRAGAACASPFDCPVDLTAELLPVETEMLAEPIVLRRDHRLRQPGRDLLQRPPALVQPFALDQPDQHQQGHRRRDEPIDQDQRGRQQRQRHGRA